MPLRLQTPPARALELLREGLESLLSTPASAGHLRSAAIDPERASALEVAAPHVVYFVDFYNLAERRIFAAARPVSWRYLLVDGNDVTSAVDLTIDHAGEIGWFSHVDSGPFVQSTVTGVEFAENFEAEGGVEFELRAISIPSVYLVALWLHGADDLLVPLAPAPAGLETERTYTEEEIISALAELIRQRGSSEDPFP
jgi:hypothetical protein